MTKQSYFIFDVKVHDPEKLQPYLEQANATLIAYGGKMIVAGGAIHYFEGTQPQGKLIIIKFSSIEQAQRWYASPEYQAIIGYRLAATQSHVYLVEGV